MISIEPTRLDCVGCRLEVGGQESRLTGKRLNKGREVGWSRQFEIFKLFFLNLNRDPLGGHREFGT